MKKAITKKSLFLLLALVVALTLGACKGERQGKEGDTTTPSTDSQTIGGPTYGGSVVVGVTQDLDSLDPHKALAAGTKEILFNVYEGLVKPDKDGNLLPAVASAFKLSDDGKTYTFTLREGIKFHDGNLVTVDDIIYSIKRCAGMLDTPESGVVSISALSNIDDVLAPDDKTVEVRLKEADTELLAAFVLEIVPRDYGKLDSFPMGTGPFRFASYAPQQNFVVTKNESYWNSEVPYLDQVTFKISANTDTAFMELKAGAIDIFPYLTDTQVNGLGNSFKIEEGNMNLVQGLFLNNKEKPFDDIRVRMAMNHAINKDEILDMVAGGRGYVIGTNMFPGFGIYYVDELEGFYPYDVEKAKDLLEEAGYENGFDLTITVPSNYQFHIDTAQVIVEQLKLVNINAKIELIEWASWLDNVYNNRNYQSTIIGLAGKLMPREILERYSSTASNNFTNFSSQSFDQVLNSAITAVDESEKIKNYKELQNILTKEAASVYIQDPSLLVAVNKKLGGYTFYPVYVQDMSVIYYMSE